MAIESQGRIEASALGSEVAPYRDSRARIFFLLMTAFVVIILATAISFQFSSHAWEAVLENEIQRNLTQKARMFASDVDNDHARGIVALTSLEGQLAGARATVIDMNGKVIADSEVRVAELEKEGRQPEFSEALRGETGVQVRSRSAFGIPIMYVAVPVSGGAVRLSYPISDVATVRSEAHNTLLLSSLLALALAFVLALISTRIVSRPKQLTDA
jgi:two-component system, OmpR family, phosphate regulon sensor histidine kinase PhoR